MHYFPFYLMHRQLMLHTYLTAHLASTLVAGSLVELFFDSKTDKKEPIEKASSEKVSSSLAIEPTKTPVASKPLFASKRFAGSKTASWVVCAAILSMAFFFWCFWLPLTYGYPSLSVEAARRRQFFGFRLQYANDYRQWAR
jgi:dolichyl-phosphate-mannose-protein mannosyltransferase